MHPVLLILALTLAQATPTPAPTANPTATPTANPTRAPTALPSATPTANPTAAPSATPTVSPTPAPTLAALPLRYGYLNLPLGGYLQIPGGSYLTDSDYTVELWAYITTNTNMSRLFEMSDSARTNAIALSSSYVDGFPSITDCWGGGTCTTDYYAQPTATNIWTHFAVTFDYVLRESKLYINSELVKTGSHSGFIDTGPRANIFVGKSTWAGEGPWAGRVDELRFWNEVRTQAQINASMNTQLVGNELGLKFYYRFDECLGNTTADLKGTAGAATLFANATLVCACEPGRYYNSSACVECPMGRFTNASGATQCNLCEAGKSAGSTASTICYDCGFGQFANRTGMSQCDGCDPGYFSGTGAFTACLPCAYGSYSGSGAFQCDTCGNGTYAPLPAATVCTNCSVFTGNATYCPTAPTPAPTATPTASPTRAPTASPTRAPTAAPTASPTAAPTAACDLGNAFNGSACVPCAAGRFSHDSGATTCMPCSAGRFSAAENATACSNCAAGTFGNVTGLSACFACAPGSATADEVSTACTPCPFGLFARAAGATACVSEGNVPLATERLNRTEITLLAPPLSSITIEPLVAASCAVPAGFRTVEMFRATGTLLGVVDVHLTSNGTRTFWPIGRELFTCVNGTWVPSYQYQCGGNATAPLDSTDDLWGKGTICHFTEFAIFDVLPATEFCDQTLGGDQPMPRICLKCAKPSQKDCGCQTTDSDNLALERPEIRIAIVGLIVFFVGRAVLIYLRTSLDDKGYEEIEGELDALVGVRNSGPSYWALVFVGITGVGMLLYLVPVMANVETDWLLHNLTRSEITRMFYGTVLVGWLGEVVHNLLFWFAYLPKKERCEALTQVVACALMYVFNVGAAVAFYASQTALYAPAVEVQTAGAYINNQLTGDGVWGKISYAHQFAIVALILDLSMHGIMGTMELLASPGWCSWSTKTGLLRWVFRFRLVTLTLAAVAWGMLRARHPCD